MTIGTRIRAARKNAKLTQEQLGKMCGFATITIRQYEAGTREPRYEQLAKIAAALKINLFDLLPEASREEYKFLNEFLECEDKTKARGARKLFEDALRFEEIDLYGDLYALDKAVEETIKDKITYVKEEALLEYLLESFGRLNKRGKYEAVERVSELEAHLLYTDDSKEL